jgi:death-on-curing protein
MIYLTLDELLLVAERAIGQQVLIRDAGLLESALARPQTVLFGEDAYPDIHTKAAALLHSICSNHALVDGNKRLALAGAIAFLGMNGWQLTMTNDEAYDLVIAVASGELEELADLATRLRSGSHERH